MEENILPLEGSIQFSEHMQDKTPGKYVLMASYLDEGHSEVEGSELSVVEKIIFRTPKFELEDGIALDKELGVWDSQGRTVVGSIKNGKHIKFPPISFDNLASISIGAAFNPDYSYRGEVEVRAGQTDGKLLGKGAIEYFDKEKAGFKIFEIDLEPSIGVDSVFFVFKNANNPDQYTMNGDWMQLNYEK